MSRFLKKSFSAAEVRSIFLEYFKSDGHCFVPPTSVLCGTGHGTYFTNAGMNQFRSIFEAERLPPYHPFYNVKKAVNSQRCIRMNDLADVGVDGYHHTLFEMLGTWAFGLDNNVESANSRVNGKKEAIYTAWELLTKVYGINPARLSVSYFGGDAELGLGPDNETREIWLQLGIPHDKIEPAGSDSNFWTMGEMGGPCGPCTEIHYETNSKDPNFWPSFLELWNIVFISFSRDQGCSRHLPRSHIDTGLGWERLVAVLNDSHSNYDTDIFSPIFRSIQTLYKLPPYQSSDRIDVLYRVIADHVRMATVAVADGVLPSNRNLGHKVRSILTRAFGLLAATREESLIDLHKTFPRLASSVLEESPLGSAYPEMIGSLPTIQRTFGDEAQRFINAWKIGKETVNCVSGGSYEVCPEMAVAMLNEYSISLEMLACLCQSLNLQVDMEAIRDIKAKQQVTRSVGCHSRMGADTRLAPEQALGLLRANRIPPTCDDPQYHYRQVKSGTGYSFPPCESTVLAVYPASDGRQLSCWLVLDRTNLHPSNLGGQATDFGVIETGDSHYQIDMVQQVGTASGECYILHRAEGPVGNFSVGQKVRVLVDETRRLAIMRAHTACHLIMAAVREIAKSVDSTGCLVSGTTQAGSSVEEDRFTIDIQTPLRLTKATIMSKVQNILNSYVGPRTPGSVKTSVMPIEEALKAEEIVRLPNEEYPPLVRVVSIGDAVSHELCCGTHVTDTCDIGAAVILNASGGRQGVKRFNVITGPSAEEAKQEGFGALSFSKSVKDALQTWDSDCYETLNDLLQSMATLRKLVGSNSLPRTDRNMLATDMRIINELALSITGSLIEDRIVSTSKKSVAIVPLAWRSLRTITTRKLVKLVGRRLRHMDLDLGLIFFDRPDDPTKKCWIMCALPAGRVNDWRTIARKFKLRVDPRKDPRWCLLDGAFDLKLMHRLQGAIESNLKSEKTGDM